MGLMAIDHASALVARVHFTEIWGVAFKGYPDTAWWFARFISHLCAPGFFFLMGISMVLLAEKRLEKGNSFKTITTYFLKRALLILLLMFFLELPAWALGMYFSEIRGSTPLPGLLAGSFVIPSSVLFGLSACMAIGTFLWCLNKWPLLLISIFSFFISNIYVSSLHSQTAFHPLQHIFMVPGMSDGAMVLYPVIPWIGVTTFGMFWAKAYKQFPRKIYKYSLWGGFFCLAAFLIVRFIGFGNFQYNQYSDWIDFFTLIKYPPSIAFILCTIGLNLILLFVFEKIKMLQLKVLLIFGQTAMFFYILHLWLYAVIGISFPKGCSMGLMYLMWAFGLMVLYLVCESFLMFKRGKSKNSFWRMI